MVRGPHGPRHLGWAGGALSADGGADGGVDRRRGEPDAAPLLHRRRRRRPAGRPCRVPARPGEAMGAARPFRGGAGAARPGLRPGAASTGRSPMPSATSMSSTWRWPWCRRMSGRGGSILPPVFATRASMPGRVDGCRQTVCDDPDGLDSERLAAPDEEPCGCNEGGVRWQPRPIITRCSASPARRTTRC